MPYLNNMNFSVREPLRHPSPAGAEVIDPDLEEAEKLAQTVKKFNIKYENTLTSHNVNDQALAIERWLESYRRGQAAARKLSESGVDMLAEMSKRLHEAVAELHRYEGEGGNPATKNQQAEIDQLTHAMRRVEQLSHEIQEASFLHHKSDDQTTN